MLEWISPVVDTVTQYAMEKGGELVQQVGPKAAQLGQKLFDTVLSRLRGLPRGQAIAEEFQDDPESYAVPVRKKLEEAAESDPEFARQLKSLFEEFEKARQQHAGIEVSGTASIATGKGAIAVTATDGSTAIGSVGGDFHQAERGKKDE
ncbi:MAG: hypothetical protein V3T83_16645 [Acidobacteriota bacterium]